MHTQCGILLSLRRFYIPTAPILLQTLKMLKKGNEIVMNNFLKIAVLVSFAQPALADIPVHIACIGSRSLISADVIQLGGKLAEAGIYSVYAVKNGELQDLTSSFTNFRTETKSEFGEGATSFSIDIPDAKSSIMIAIQGDLIQAPTQTFEKTAGKLVILQKDGLLVSENVQCSVSKLK